jgi:hypothetical protein
MDGQEIASVARHVGHFAAIKIVPLSLKSDDPTEIAWFDDRPRREQDGGKMKIRIQTDSLASKTIYKTPAGRAETAQSTWAAASVCATIQAMMLALPDNSHGSKRRAAQVKSRLCPSLPQRQSMAPILPELRRCRCLKAL